jgi:site-specific recombinase XerD
MKAVYQLDAWIEGYLNYLRDVKRLTPTTVKDVRCTLRRVAEYMDGSRAPATAVLAHNPAYV